jgi:hypothetical protein
MSHIVEMDMKNVKITDRNTLFAACRRLKLAEPVFQKVRLFEGIVEGWTVKLEGWHYPVAINLETGVIKGDNYNGVWGKAEELAQLEVAYATEAALKLARESHRFASIEETVDLDGSIEIRCIEYV